MVRDKQKIIQDKLTAHDLEKIIPASEVVVRVSKSGAAGYLATARHSKTSSEGVSNLNSTEEEAIDDSVGDLIINYRQTHKLINPPQ